MSRLSRLRLFARDSGGATAIEYGLVLPIFITLIMGSIWAGLLMWSVSSLEAAVHAAARCSAVSASQCGTPLATESFAETAYSGPDIAPVFTASDSGCGHTVSVQANFDLNIVPGIGATPLTATACYP